MASDSKFDSIFDYNSAFKYHSAVIPNSLNRHQYKSVFSYQSVNLTLHEDADKFESEDFASILMRKILIFLSHVILLISFPLSAVFCIKRVLALERIVLFRLGKLQPVQGPGFTYILPLVDLWTRVDLRPQNFKLSTSELLTSDGGIVQVCSEVEYEVSDIVRYVTKLRSQEQTLKELSTYCLTNIIAQKDVEDLKNNSEAVCAAIKHELNQVSLEWGLEILTVSLLSVKVLKEAEPVNALGTILTALKAATDNTTAVFPLIPDSGSKNQIPDGVEQSNGMDILKKVLLAAEGTKDIRGCFKFDVIGDETRTAYCSFENGHVSISEDPNVGPHPDVSLVMSEDNARDFLHNGISPLQAYVDGKVAVSGNWKLLRPLAKVLERPVH